MIADARLAAHWAAQLAAAPASLLPRAPDDSHASLEWRSGVLFGAPVDGRRAGLRVDELTLVIDSGASLPLSGRTLADGLAWLSERFGRAVVRPSHDLPASPIATGGAFPPVTSALGDLARLFATADTTLRALAASTAGASPVRCWPHHFDIATLISLDAPHRETSIGAGLSPGDASYADPYWYVTPWPYPPLDRLPHLPAGHWHTERWVGAVLPASEAPPAAFIAAAVAACRTLLAGQSGI
jgi:hypothetical protein